MIRIVADTLSCISVEEAKKLGIPLLPQLVIFGDQTYRDDTEMGPAAFLEKLASTSIRPKTAAPEPIRYQPIFEKLAKEKSTILVICPSAKVSGTVRSAETAVQDFPGRDIRVVDTELLAAGLGTLVTESIKWVEKGLDAETIIKKVMELSEKNRTIFMVDTLEYLRRGGRIGNASALIGSLLDMKPILSFRHGQVEPLDKQRTKKRAISKIFEIMEGECPHNENAHLTVMHGGNIEEAEALAAQMKNLFGLKEVPVKFAPPAILVHSGPGVIAVSYFVQ
jgi:DegV family protein with EDD domain